MLRVRCVHQGNLLDYVEVFTRILYDECSKQFIYLVDKLGGKLKKNSALRKLKDSIISTNQIRSINIDKEREVKLILIVIWREHELPWQHSREEIESDREKKLHKRNYNEHCKWNQSEYISYCSL